MLVLAVACGGGDKPDADGYMVQMDAEPAQPIQAAGSIQYAEVTPGAHTVQLAGLAPNCTIAGENPRSVNVAAGETATVAFAVTCGATTGGLQVTAATSGPSTDADGYILTVDGTTKAPATLNGVSAGRHTVALSGIASNCSVTDGASREVNVRVGGTA